MSIFQTLTVAIFSFALITALESAGSFAIAAQDVGEIKPKASQRSLLIAKNTKKSGSKRKAKAKTKTKKKSVKKIRERHIVREAKVRKNKRNIDFDAIDITGERKTPFGSVVSQNKADKDFDLIKIRLRWHPEMIQSSSSIETGRSD